MNKPKEIILHCAATVEGKNYTAKDIDKWHKDRGFKKIGYHYVIGLNGDVEKGRNESENGAHCTGHNSKSIGICYIGGIDKNKKAKDTRTDKQKIAMYKLVDDIMNRYNIPLSNVHGHYEFANKACPSFKIDKFREEFTDWKNNNKNNNKVKNVLLTTINKKGGWKGILSLIIYKIMDFFMHRDEK